MSKGLACRTYYNPNPFIGVSWHDTTIPLPVPPFMGPAKLPHIDFSVVQGLWLGSFLSNGREKTVVSEDLLFVGRMSDAGFVVPHISIPPTWWNLLTTLFGMSNSVFGSSAVTVACKNLLWGNEDCDLAVTPFGPVPFSINVACWDPISLPTDLVVVWGTVYAGFTLADLAAAALEYAQTVASDLISAGASKGLGKLGKAIGDSSAWKKLGSKFSGSYSKVGMKKAAKATSQLNAFERYVAKAAQAEGIAKVLKMSDDDLAEYATSSALKNSSSYASDLTKHVDDLSSNPLYKKLVSKNDDLGQRMAKQVLNSSDISSDAVKRMLATKDVLTPALRELDDAIAKVASLRVAGKLTGKIVVKSAQKLLRMGLRSGNWLGSGSEGGALSSGGLGITDYFERELQMKDRWYAGELGIDEADDDWEDAYVKTGDDDYWYELDAEEDAASEAEDEEDDDYWYGESQTEGAA